MALKRANGTERFDRRSMLRHYNGLGSSAGGKLGGGGLHKSQPRVVLTGHGAFASVRGRSASLFFSAACGYYLRELALPNAIITLTTDYGLNDHLVGTLKGVILKINPEATIVDITHGVAPFDLLDGAAAAAGERGQSVFCGAGQWRAVFDLRARCERGGAARDGGTLLLAAGEQNVPWA